jgi:predicted lipoprotein with Yx(FWY)xxD motif
MLRGQAALRGSLAIGALAAGAAAMAACAGQAVLGSSVTTVASPVSATIFVAKIPGLGRALVTSGGRTLYLLSSDPPGKSN